MEKNPEKIKELTSREDIEEMVDEYVRNQFEDVLADGTKAKFRYIKVKPESYGLSDQQILFGDDKDLNQYVSVKKIAPYVNEEMKLRNSIYNKKIKSIKKSAKENKKNLQKNQIQRGFQSRTLGKLRKRNVTMKLRRMSQG